MSSSRTRSTRPGTGATKSGSRSTSPTTLRFARFESCPNFDELYVGLEGWRRFWSIWEKKWSGISVERIEDLDEHGVLVLLTLEGEGGAGYGSMPMTHWLQFIGGKIAGLTALAADAAERRYAERD